jgi:hypothetical protein
MKPRDVAALLLSLVLLGLCCIGCSAGATAVSSYVANLLKYVAAW